MRCAHEPDFILPLPTCAPTLSSRTISIAIVIVVVVVVVVVIAHEHAEKINANTACKNNLSH